MFHLDFKPLKTPPSALPTCVWNGLKLWSGSVSLQPVDLSSLNFHEAFRSIYENIGFCELAFVLTQIHEQKIEVDKSALFAAYNFRFDNKLEKLLETWTDVPQTFKEWAKNHAVSPADVYPLCALEAVAPLAPGLIKIADIHCSRSQGAQILELLTECTLLNIPQQDLLAHSETPQEWLLGLQQLRFPQTQNRDIERQEKLLAGWPKTFSTRWLRQGDRSGVEVRFFVSSKKELAEKITTLSRVHEGLE
ncbi:MAG: hypothetical protein IT287_01905 [Bdellovibrionaceae bacterium]|nr:hypothetical protein [Pseudobdellovibrionaceae bacterium]